VGKVKKVAMEEWDLELKERAVVQRKQVQNVHERKQSEKLNLNVCVGNYVSRGIHYCLVVL